MKKLSAKENILLWLQNNPGWHHNGDLQRLEFKNKNGTNATGDTIKRRLQNLAEEGKIFVEHRPDAFYGAEYKPKLKQVVHFEEKEGVRVAVVELVPIS